MTSDIVITGIGVASSAGFGSEALWEALIEKRRCFRSVVSPRGKGKERLCAAINDVDAFLADKRWRRAAEISKFSIAAIRLALEDAGIDPAKWNSREAGLVTAVTHGAIRFTIEFHESVVVEGPAAASPMVFSDSVLNAPAGNSSIAFNVKGGAHTVIGDLGAGMLSVSTAIRTMRYSGLKVCLAGATEEFDHVVNAIYARLGLIAPDDGGKEAMRPFSDKHSGFIAGEGACFLVLEEKTSALARGARIYAEIKYAKTPLAAMRSLDAADPGETIIFSGANGTYTDKTEGAALKRLFDGKTARPYICCIKPLIGESFAASSMMQVAAAAMSIHKKTAPPSNITGGIDGIKWAKHADAPQSRMIKTAIASAAGYNDGGGMLVLKALE